MAPSMAFDLALEEVVRIWDAADHLDSKILQFASILAAGFLAGVGWTVRSFASQASQLQGASGGIAGALIALGVVAFAVFFGLMLRAAIGVRFAGPLDPRQLARQPGYLTDDRQFER